MWPDFKKKILKSQSKEEVIELLKKTYYQISDNKIAHHCQKVLNIDKSRMIFIMCMGQEKYFGYGEFDSMMGSGDYETRDLLHYNICKCCGEYGVLDSDTNKICVDCGWKQNEKKLSLEKYQNNYFRGIYGDLDAKPEIKRETEEDDAFIIW